MLETQKLSILLVNKRFLRNNLLLGQEGVYKKNNGEVKIMIYNLSDVEVDLPPGLRVGFVRPQMMEEEREINQLDHRVAEELTNEELAERRDSIWTKLKLEENEILTNNPLIMTINHIFWYFHSNKKCSLDA